MFSPSSFTPVRSSPSFLRRLQTPETGSVRPGYFRTGAKLSILWHHVISYFSRLVSPYVVFSTRPTPDKDETASDSDKQKVAASPASTTTPPKATYEQDDARDDAILVSPLR